MSKSNNDDISFNETKIKSLEKENMQMKKRKYINVFEKTRIKLKMNFFLKKKIKSNHFTKIE